MIIGLEGDLGTGKTIMMVRYLCKDLNDLQNDVMSNMTGLKFGKLLNVYEVMGINEKTKVKDIDIKKMKQLNSVSIGIDEITVFMDCRRSQSKMNLLLSYFVLQTRKRNVNLYFTTQDFGMVDFRLWKYINIMVLCDFVYDENGNSITDWRHYTLIDKRNKYNISVNRFNMKISKYYDLYDTNEVIIPPI